MKNKPKQAAAEIKKSSMMDELSQLKIYGGRTVEAQKLSMANCKSICIG